MAKQRLQGIVVSDAMAKTVVVRVERLVEHPKYKKRYRTHSSYKAHDERNEFHPGDAVIIEQTRPMSKEKCWIVVGKI